MSVWFLHVGKTDFVYDVPFICTEKAGIRHQGKVHTARVPTSLLKVSSSVEFVLKMNGDCGNESQDSAYTNFLK